MESRMTPGTRQGFTLIEVVAVLVILAIVGGIGTLLIGNVVEGFGFVRDSAAIAQKAQLALGRLTYEFARITSIDPSSDADSIAYTADLSTMSDVVTESHSVAIDGQRVTYDGAELADGVEAMELHYYAADGGTEVSPAAARLIEVGLMFRWGSGATKTFTTRAAVP